jgi:isoamylase
MLFSDRRQVRTVVTTEMNLPGEPYPLGGSLTEAGVNFALYSEDGTAVELCLSNSAGPDAGELRLPVIEQLWHVFLPVIGPGQLSCELLKQRGHWRLSHRVQADGE